MKSKLLRAAATAALLVAGGALVLPAGAATPKLSSAVGKKLMEAQKASAAKDFQAALKAVQEAQAESNLSNYDKQKIYQFLTFIEVSLGDQAAADAAAEAAADLPEIAEEDKAEVVRNAMVLAINAQHYDKALNYAKQVAAMTPAPDAKTQAIINQAYYLGGDYAAAQASAQKAIDAAIAAGKVPERNDLQIVLSAQVKQKDEAGAEVTLEKLVAYYNDPKDWTQMIDIALGTPGLRDLDAIYLGRLMFAVGAQVSAQDASLFGSTASHLTFYGDAMNAEQHGGTGFPSPDAKAAADKKAMPQQIVAGQKQGGEYNVKLAEALYSYGMYPEAEAAARLAQSKGNAKDPSEPAMVIAMSQIAQGQYQAGIDTLNTVKGGGPATPRIVRLWTDYAKTKLSPPAAAPATAAAQ
jgi:hypothetical protein